MWELKSGRILRPQACCGPWKDPEQAITSTGRFILGLRSTRKRKEEVLNPSSQELWLALVVTTNLRTYSLFADKNGYSNTMLTSISEKTLSQLLLTNLIVYCRGIIGVQYEILSLICFSMGMDSLQNCLGQLSEVSHKCGFLPPTRILFFFWIWCILRKM